MEPKLQDIVAQFIGREKSKLKVLLIFLRMLKRWESLGKHFSFKCSKHILSLERYTFEVRHLDNLSCQGRIQLFILLTSDILNNIGVYHQNNGINYQNFGNNIESTISLYRTQGKKLIFHSNALNTKNSVVMIKGKAKKITFYIW